MTQTLERYGITENKKAELDKLTLQVQNAEYEVQQLQSVVASLTEKSGDFSAFLDKTTANKTTALDNLDRLDTVLKSLSDLANRAQRVGTQSHQSKHHLQDTAINLSGLINELIFTAETVDKLSLLVNKKKALNPLISDELVQVVTTATEDANTAIAATLTALQSCHTAMATGEEAAMVSQLEQNQASDLYTLMTGDKASDSLQTATTEAQSRIEDVEKQLASVKQAEDNLGAALNTETQSKKKHDAAQSDVDFALAQSADETDQDTTLDAQIKARNNHIEAREKWQMDREEVATTKAALAENVARLNRALNRLRAACDEQLQQPLKTLLTQAYEQSVRRYSEALDANNRVSAELEEAQSSLARAEVRLASLKAGLAAAKAAALAA